MKKFDLVHTTILIIALMMGYSAISKLLGIFSDLAYLSRLDGMGSPGSDLILYDFLLALLFAAGCVILVKRGRIYAAAILKAEPEEVTEEPAELQFDRNTLIFVLIIGMGLYTLLQFLPYFLVYFFELFRDKIGKTDFRGQLPNKDRIFIDALGITLGAFLIYAAPALTRLVDRQEKSRKHQEL